MDEPQAPDTSWGWEAVNLFCGHCGYLLPRPEAARRPTTDVIWTHCVGCLTPTRGRWWRQQTSGPSNIPGEWFQPS